MSDDLLDRLLDLGLKEESLGPRTARAFAEALRQRARLVLDERVRVLEERNAILGRENAWREETVRNLQEENRWRQGAMEMLEAQAASLEREIQAVREEWQKAAAAHDRLLAHHRQLVARFAGALGALPGELPWGFRRVKKRLAELAAALRKELE